MRRKTFTDTVSERILLPWQPTKGGGDPATMIAHSVEAAMAAGSARPMDFRIVCTRLEAGAHPEHLVLV